MTLNEEHDYYQNMNDIKMKNVVEHRYPAEHIEKICDPASGFFQIRKYDQYRSYRHAKKN